MPFCAFHVVKGMVIIMEKVLEKGVCLQQRRLVTATVLGALAAIAPLCTDLYLPAFPAVAVALSASASEVQLSLTSSLLGIAAGQLLFGPLSDIRGRRGPLILSLVLFMVSSFLCALATSVEALIALRFLQGLAGSGGVVLSRAVACDLYEGSELTKFFSLLMLMNGVAPIASPVIGGQILKLTEWQGIFVFLAFCGLLLCCAVFFLLPESLAEAARGRGGFRASFDAFGSLLQNRRFLQFTCLHSLVIAGLFAYIAASPFVLQEIYGLSAEAFSFCFAFNGLGIMVFAQATGRLSARFGEARVLRWGLWLALTASVAVLAAAAVQPASAFWMIAPLFLVVSCVGITTTTSFALAIGAQKGSAGSASGIVGVLSFVCGAAVSPLVGLGGSQTALPLGIALFALSILALLLGRSAAKTSLDATTMLSKPGKM